MAVEGFSRNSFSILGGFHRKPPYKEAKVVNHILDVPPNQLTGSSPPEWHERFLVAHPNLNLYLPRLQPVDPKHIISAKKPPPGSWNQPSRFGANLLTRGIGWRYTPQNKHGTWKWTLGKGDSYWKPPFPGSMLIFGGVCFGKLKSCGEFPRNLQQDPLNRPLNLIIYS